MWVIFDNLNALIVGGVLFLMLLGVQQRVAEINLEQSVNYIIKRQANDLATWLEDDLLRMGENVDFASEAPYENPVYDNATGVTTQFVFFRDSIASDGSTIRLYIRYRLVSVGKRALQGDSIAVYRLLREERVGSGSWQYSGSSPALLSYFRIDLLDRDAKPLSDPVAQKDQMQNTRVRFTMVTPFEVARSQVLRQVYYGSTLLVRRIDSNS